MKKILGIILFFIFSTTYASNCSLISPTIGTGARYDSVDQSQNASLWISTKKGHPGISGAFGAVVNGTQMSAPLFDSLCLDNVVYLNWDVPGFTGYLLGTIDANNTIQITKETINGQSITSNLIFSYYIQ